MKPACLIAAFALLTATALAGQGGQAGGSQPPDFQTRMPWAAWEGGFNSAWGGVPRAQQVVEPFKMFDNMYYVGLQNNSVLLITTSAGLILIDAAFPDTADLIANNVRKLGFDPADIRYILISHGHNDHFGGAGRFKQLAPGARVGVSGPDWELIALQQGAPASGLPLTRDLVLNDNDVIKVGDTAVTVHTTPGHSIGSVAFEIPARLGGRTYRLINMRLSIRQANALELSEAYVKSIEKLKQRGPWDGILPEHAFTPILRGPLTAKDVYLGYQSNPGMEGPNASVQGAAFTSQFLDDVLKVAGEKLAYDRANPMPPGTIPGTKLPSPYGK
jgi:glyoxylase-like metal-dependent hydrolase (beta-lactamase superfamily II)